MPEPGAIFEQVTLHRSGRAVVDGLSCLFPGQGVTALIGPNGAGKSLSLRLLAGLIAPDRGTVRFAEGRPAPRDLAMVFQKPVLLRRTVGANLDHALAAYRTDRRTRPDLRSRLLEQGELTALANRPARKLSGGEQQRLALVRALAAGPRYLLLDEPSASLDPASTAKIEALICAAANEGTAVVLVPHDQAQASRLADRVVFLHQGRAVETGTAEGFFQKPQTKEAEAYLSGELLV